MLFDWLSLRRLRQSEGEEIRETPDRNVLAEYLEEYQDERPVPVVAVATLHPEQLERTRQHDQIEQQAHDHEHAADFYHPLLRGVHLEVFGQEVDEPYAADAQQTEGAAERADQQFLCEGGGTTTRSIDDHLG